MMKFGIRFIAQITLICLVIVLRPFTARSDILEENARILRDTRLADELLELDGLLFISFTNKDSIV